MKSFCLFLIAVLAICCFFVAESEEKKCCPCKPTIPTKPNKPKLPSDSARLFAEEAKKYNFCTKICGSLSGPILGPMKTPCMARCKNVRDSAIVQGQKVIVCKRICGYFQGTSYYKTCHSNCMNVKQKIVAVIKKSGK